jgi:diguanylate cyclase (GGDEF)-like protein/PAS domain S-box-containing protein
MKSAQVPFAVVREAGVTAFLARVAVRVNRSADFTGALRAVLEETCAFAEWPLAHAYLVEQAAHRRLVSSGVWYARDASVPARFRAHTETLVLEETEGLPSRCLANRIPQYATDLDGDPRFANGYGEDTMRAWIGVPVIDNENVIAVVEFFARHQSSVDPLLLDSLKTVGLVLGASHERSRARERLQFLTNALENASDAVVIYERTGDPEAPLRIVYVNSTFELQTGHTRDAVLGQRPTFLYGPRTDMTRAVMMRDRVLRGESVRTEILKYRKDGSEFWTDVTMRPLSGPDGRFGYVVAIQRDITEQLSTRAKLELLSNALDQASDMIAMFERAPDGGWAFFYANQTFYRTTGYARDEVLGRAPAFLEGPRTESERLERFRKGLFDGKPCRAQVALYRKDGSVFWVDLTAQPIAAPDGIVSNTVVVYHDVTETVIRQETLSYEAAHDPLTGTYNRRYFLQALEDAVGQARVGACHALLFLDLDRFKPINDHFGHAAGDAMLSLVAEAVQRSMRDRDIVARLGGDEFALLLHDCVRDVAVLIAQRILEALQGTRLQWAGVDLQIGGSLGVLMLTGDVPDAADALERVDRACYEAKNGGGNRVIVA